MLSQLMLWYINAQKLNKCWGVYLKIYGSVIITLHFFIKINKYISKYIPCHTMFLKWFNLSQNKCFIMISLLTYFICWSSLRSKTWTHVNLHQTHPKTHPKPAWKNTNPPQTHPKMHKSTPNPPENEETHPKPIQIHLHSPKNIRTHLIYNPHLQDYMKKKHNHEINPIYGR